MSNFGEECVKRRLLVFWPLDDAWYPGKAIPFNAETQEHTILYVYDDGEKETSELAKERFEWKRNISMIWWGKLLSCVAVPTTIAVNGIFSAENGKKKSTSKVSAHSLIYLLLFSS